MYSFFEKKQKHIDLVRYILQEECEAENRLDSSCIVTSVYKGVVDEADCRKLSDEEVSVKVMVMCCVELVAHGRVKEARRIVSRLLLVAEYFFCRDLISKEVWDYVHAQLSSFERMEPVSVRSKDDFSD
jgi:uncharacterized protein with ACT and thioredoxin-like domain